MQSHIRKVYVCLVVTCQLHFWQNDRGLLRATAVTWGWNGYWNKSQHRKLTLEKKILPLLQQGFEPTTFWSQVWRSNHWAIPAKWPLVCLLNFDLCYKCVRVTEKSHSLVNRSLQVQGQSWQWILHDAACTLSLHDRKAYMHSIPSLSEVSPMLPLKQFQCSFDWWWPFKEDCWALLLSSIQSVVWCPWLWAQRHRYKLLWEHSTFHFL